MAEKNNAFCDICGEPYYLCISCRDAMKANPWKIHCDTAVHYQVYQVVHGFNTGVYTKDEAKMKFKNINLDDMNTFRPHIKKVIEDILKEDKPVVKPVKKVVEPLKAEITKVEEKVIAEKAITPRKRNLKEEVEE
jgi:hypothetical protein